jgi:hypothetical protein
VRSRQGLEQVLTSLRLEKRPDKTFIDKIERGFDLLGYRFGSSVFELAEAMLERFVDQATRSYEQGRRERIKAPSFGRRAGRWLGWANGGRVSVG